MPHQNTPRGYRYGRSQTKNIAFAAWHAPLGGCAEEADLCRGQGFRRIAPPAPPRPQDRHVQGPAGSEGQEGIVMVEGRRKSVPLPELSPALPEFGHRVRGDDWWWWSERCFARTAPTSQQGLSR